jgi:hypothetical protein
MRFATPIKLDKERNLRYSIKSIKHIEQYFGCPVKNVDWENLTIDGLIAVIHAGLKHEDKDLTHDQVEDILDAVEDLDYVSKTLSEAMQKKDNAKNE